MKIYILTENTASGKFLAEHGISYYIEHDKNILFDAGHTDVFLKNAKKFKIDIDLVKTVVLSHGHWDHGNGLQFIKDKKLICHPDVFLKRYRKNENKNIGLAHSYENLKTKFEINFSRNPFNISQNIIFLGGIPRKNSFESKNTKYKLENGSDDFIIDDSGLVIKLKNEIIVISGCAHSGICNIIEYSKKITKIDRIRAVIGGFHLKQNDEQTQKTIKYLKTQDIQEIYPSHCTDLPALCAFYSEFNIKHLKTGMILNFR